MKNDYPRKVLRRNLQPKLNPETKQVENAATNGSSRHLGSAFPVSQRPTREGSQGGNLPQVLTHSSHTVCMVAILRTGGEAE